MNSHRSCCGAGPQGRARRRCRPRGDPNPPPPSGAPPPERAGPLSQLQEITSTLLRKALLLSGIDTNHLFATAHFLEEPSSMMDLRSRRQHFPGRASTAVASKRPSSRTLCSVPVRPLTALHNKVDLMLPLCGMTELGIFRDAEDQSPKPLIGIMLRLTNASICHVSSRSRTVPFVPSTSTCCPSSSRVVDRVQNRHRPGRHTGRDRHPPEAVVGLLRRRAEDATARVDHRRKGGHLLLQALQKTGPFRSQSAQVQRRILGGRRQVVECKAEYILGRVETPLVGQSASLHQNALADGVEDEKELVLQRIQRARRTARSPGSGAAAVRAGCPQGDS